MRKWYTKAEQARFRLSSLSLEPVSLLFSLCSVGLSITFPNSAARTKHQIREGLRIVQDAVTGKLTQKVWLQPVDVGMPQNLLYEQNYVVENFPVRFGQFIDDLGK